MEEHVICEKYELIKKTAYNNKHEYCWITGHGVEMNVDSHEKCKGCPLNKVKIINN